MKSSVIFVVVCMVMIVTVTVGFFTPFEAVDAAEAKSLRATLFDMLDKKKKNRCKNIVDATCTQALGKCTMKKNCKPPYTFTSTVCGDGCGCCTMQSSIDVCKFEDEKCSQRILGECKSEDQCDTSKGEYIFDKTACTSESGLCGCCYPKIYY